MFKQKIKNTLQVVDEVLTACNVSYSKKSCSFSLESFTLSIRLTLKPSASPAADVAAVRDVLKARGVRCKISPKLHPYSPFVLVILVPVENNTCSTCWHWTDYETTCRFSGPIDGIYAELEGDSFGVAVQVADDSGLAACLKTGPDFGCVRYKQKRSEND